MSNNKTGSGSSGGAGSEGTFVSSSRGELPERPAAYPPPCRKLFGHAALCALLTVFFLLLFADQPAKSTEIPLPLDTIKLEVLGDTSLSVIWEKETGDISYKVQWKSGTQEYSSSRQKVLSADTLEAPGGLASTSITGLAPATTYTVRLKVEDHASLGTWSEEATATTTFGCDGQSTQGLKDDCAALVALYDSTGGANWTKKTKWKTSSPLGEWYGVWVKNGRVSDIVISGNNMSGTIPDLSKLTELRALRLHHSKNLSGTVPDLSALTKLEYIYLPGNSLSGTVPAGLNSLTKLKSIWLDSNNLSGTIPDLSANTNLRVISIYDTSLSGTIPDLSSLTELTSLRLFNNNLSGPVPNLSSSSKLRYLYLDGNNLTGTVSSSSFPGSVVKIDLSRNQLRGPVPDLGSGYGKLAYLHLNDNSFNGSIPSGLGSKSSLVGLDLSDNLLTGAIPAMESTGLAYLFLHNNSLSGTIPDLSSSGDLVELGLWGNPGLSGDITLHSSVGLEVVDRAALLVLRDTNGAWTEISSDLASWDGVTVSGGRVTGLDVSGKGLKGEISNSLEAMDALTSLNLSNNSSLSGTLPSSLSSSLTTLNTCGTSITVPSGLQGLLAACD